MKKLTSVIISAVALTLIAGVATAALAATNALTKDRIAENNARAADEARRKVFQEAETFQEESFEYDGNTVVYHVALKGDEPIGYVFTAKSRGKSSGMMVMTAVNTDGSVHGVSVTENNETAGYISKVESKGLFAAFVGKNTTDGVDSVSQATKTSKGVIAGVETALTYYAEMTSAKGE